MTSERIRDFLVEIWKGPLAEAYLRGELGSQTKIKAEVYRHFQNLGLPELTIWLDPAIHFPPFIREEYLKWRQYRVKRYLEGEEIDLLITQGTDIIAAIELNFDPGGYGDFRRDMKHLCALSELAGEGLVYLARDPKTGKLDDGRPYLLAEDLLCIYAVINQQASMGLEMESLKKAHPQMRFPAYFLHLQAAIQQDKVRFGYKV